MGRKRGFLAVEVGLTAGAEVILVPEVEYDEKAVLETIRKNASIGKNSSIIVIAEGVGKTTSLAVAIEKNVGVEVRVSVLGYVQRGGSPTARSRYLASIFAAKAIESLLDGKSGIVVGIQKSEVTSISLEESCSNEKPLNIELLKLAEKLAI
jgi:6-phosphofructokinase 1